MAYGRNIRELRTYAGSLEFLSQDQMVPKRRHAHLLDDKIKSADVWNTYQESQDVRLEAAVDAVKNARVVIINPPFTNRAKMGEKFSSEDQQSLRARVNELQQALEEADPVPSQVIDKNSIGQLFEVMAGYCLQDKGVLAMVLPTLILCSTSSLNKRRYFGDLYHIHTIVTCHLPGQINMSQNTSINESLIIVQKHIGENKPPTRFVHLDRFPMKEDDVHELCKLLREGRQLNNGWGEVSYWPAERILSGDWSPGIWRIPELASESWKFANDVTSIPLHSMKNVQAHETGRVLRGNFKSSSQKSNNSFPIIKSKGADGQLTLRSNPDAHWRCQQKGSVGESKTNKVLRKAGHLLISAGQRLSTARLNAVASENKYLGNGWTPITGLTVDEAKALAVFLNSSIGRLQIMRSRGLTLDFPKFSTKEIGNTMVPDIQNDEFALTVLSQCYDRTCDAHVPQYRDGECEVRIEWDRAVEKALGWYDGYLGNTRASLHKEPYVRGMGINQFKEAVESFDEVES